MSVWTPTAIANDPLRDRAHSSCRTTVVKRSAPPPPYFSSYSTPRKPSAPMRGQIDFGMRPAASHASICGATSRSTKARTAARNRWWCSAKIVTPGGVPGSLADDVGLQWTERAEELLLLALSHLVLVERLDQVLDRRVPLGLGDLHALVRRLHVLAVVRTGSAARLADLVGETGRQLAQRLALES